MSDVAPEPNTTAPLPDKDDEKHEDAERIKEERVSPPNGEGSVVKFDDAGSEHKLEDGGEATGDDVAPNLVEANSTSGDTKLIKDLDDEAPKTFPQVVSQPDSMVPRHGAL